MKTIALSLFLFTSILLSQTIEKLSINKLMLESKYSQVVEVLEEKVKSGVELSFNEKFNLALSYQRLVNHRKAINILGFLRREEPNNTSVLFAIGESYRAMSNSLFASNAYKTVLVKDSTNIMARIELGKLYIKMKYYSKAKDIFQHLVSLDSTNTYYLRQYGFSLYKLGELKKAEKHLKTAIRLNDFDPKAPLWLSKIYFDQEKYKDALKIIKRSILLHTIDLPLNKLAAEIYFKMKRYKSATVQYYNVIILGDSSSVVYQKLGLSLYSSVATRDSLSENEKEEKLLEAVAALEKSLAKDKFLNPLTLTYLGFCFKVLKEYGQSIMYLEEALNAMIPEYIDKVYSTLGASYELTENYYDAIIAYSKSLENSNESPNSVFRLATLYDRYYADKTVALAHYEKYLRLNGDENNEFSKYAEDSIERLKGYIHFRQ